MIDVFNDPLESCSTANSSDRPRTRLARVGIVQHHAGPKRRHIVVQGEAENRDRKFYQDVQVQHDSKVTRLGISCAENATLTSAAYSLRCANWCVRFMSSAMSLPCVPLIPSDHQAVLLHTFAKACTEMTLGCTLVSSVLLLWRRNAHHYCSGRKLQVR